MRWIIWASSVSLLMALTRAAGAADKPTLLDRGRDVVQACWDKCSKKHGHVSHHAPALPCDDSVVIGRLITQLESAPKSCDRRRAANALENFDWRQHPEIVAALTGAMQSDPAPVVRWDAADALKEMRVCDPTTLAALDFSRQADPCSRVRSKAKWGLIQAEKSRPLVLTYVSGYAKSEPGRGGPELLPAPRPRANDDMPPQAGGATEPAFSMRSFISARAARVKSRF